MTTRKNTNHVMLQVAAGKVGARMPGMLAVGQTELEIHPPTTDGSFVARWTKGTSQGAATIDIRPASKTSTELAVTLERPKGAQAFLWPTPTLRRLELLLSHALAYEIETRSVEEASAFGIRRTSAELVKARAS